MRCSNFSVERRDRMRSTYSGNANGVNREMRTWRRSCSPIMGHHRPQAIELKLLIVHFAIGLREQRMMRLVLSKHIEQERGTHLKMARRLARRRGALVDEARHPGNLAKRPLGQFRIVERRMNICFQALHVGESMPDFVGTSQRLRRK